MSAKNRLAFTKIYGTVIVYLIFMRVIIISGDQKIIQAMKKIDSSNGLQIIFYNKAKDPLDVVINATEVKSGLVVLDDDYLKPNSVKILKYLKKLDSNLATIFLTSDTSIQLGREITKIGTKYYAIKPITEIDLINLIKSIAQLRAKVNLFKTKQEK